ncbi:thiamin biosynthesis protein [Gandjariella thermophila]|uniref:Thiamin biosynthesis protein n=1 Tax=Gandjariella thermophila TaxID=1931992 RepID=A0A4D4JFM5_9PSEU|nr:thiamin biosynthesis protein [Gandjariella thermophila]
MLPGLAVLRRAPDEVQVGTDPRHAVVIGGLCPPLADLLTTLDGRHTLDELVHHAAERGVDRSAVLELLDALATAGLLDDAAPSTRSAAGAPGRLTADSTTWTLRTGHPRARVPDVRRESAVVVHGDGRLAVAVAVLLAAAGVGRVQVAAAGVVQPEDTGCGYLDSDVGRPRREAAKAAVRRAASGADGRALPPHRRPDLAVLADAVVPDPALVAALVADQIPHLVVRAREGTGLVGPLVLPGRTSCLRCADLYRTDRDPCWPRVAAQLGHRPQPADLATAQATAALAVGQALLALEWPRHGTRPLVWDTTLELDPLRAALRRRRWPRHPSCCGAHREPALHTARPGDEVHDTA